MDVRFVREEAPATAAETPTIPVPPEVSRDLTDVLISLDVSRIGEIMRRISELDPALGDALAQHVNQLSYTTILKALWAAVKVNLTKEAL